MAFTQRQLILRTAVHYLRTTVKVDRALAVFEGDGHAYGFDAGSLWDSADLSQGMLEEMLAEDRPTLVPDALSHPVFVQRTSALLSNVGAVIFLPIRDHGGITRGFLYLDQRRQNNVPLTQPILERIQSYASGTLEPMLHSLVRPLSWQEALKVEWCYPSEPGSETLLEISLPQADPAAPAPEDEVDSATTRLVAPPGIQEQASPRPGRLMRKPTLAEPRSRDSSGRSLE